jgi:cation:H+ antiporter
MVGGADTFVAYVKATSEAAGISPLVLSLIVTPIATELPEKFNSVIWVRKGKDTLALGNITGAMVFQSCFPVVFGIVGTDWDLLAEGGKTLFSALLTLASGSFLLLWVQFRRSLSPWALLVGGLFYAAFLAYLFMRT